MSVISALNTQTLASSNQVEVETKSAQEIATEDAEQQQADFLALLLTQLEVQNPLDPMDTDEFSAQLTRYSILEQGIETNANLTVTNDYLKSSNQNTALSYINDTVEVSSNFAPVQDDGIAYWSYEVQGNAKDVKLTFLNEKGERIQEVSGSTSSGIQDIAFDAGSFGVPAGSPIEIVIAARDVEDKVLASRVSSYSEVDGIWSDGDESYLTFGSVSYRFNDVLKVSELPLTGSTQTPTQTP